MFPFLPTMFIIYPQKAILLHRVIGYTVLSLVIISIPGALMIMRHSMGGGLDLQAAVVGLSAATIFAIVMAYINIKRLQIDQHRKWVLRAMIWMSLIITARVLMFIFARIISDIGGYNTVCYPQVSLRRRLTSFKRSGIVRKPNIL